ncbi:MAG: branched-chain amino acid ABC transporter ATP-binding protein/permease [Rhodospirillales bacterium]|nr:branched-chain amino acid ABC transporter ATP-binding protein/permease [Rhodospirillales bacterium]
MGEPRDSWLARGITLPLALGAAGIALHVLRADAYGQRLMTIAGIFVLLVLGYQIIFGRLGVLSLAQGAFFGIGAYATAILATRAGLPFVLTFPLSVAIPCILAAIVAVPVLRLESHYFALATLGLGQVLLIGAVNWESLTGGGNGIAGVPDIQILGRHIPRGLDLTVFVWVTVALAAAAAWQIGRGIFGHAAEIVREAPLAAGAAGIDAGRLRFAALVMSAGYGGGAGALYAHAIGVVSPDVLELPIMIACLSMAMVGGRLRIAGAVVGAVLLIHLPEWFRFLERYALFAYGAALLVAILAAPDGIVGALERLRRRYFPEPSRAAPAAIPFTPRPAGKATGPLLAIRGLSKSFGGVTAVDNVSLAMQRGEILGLIGPNGSGKTTLINAITGLVLPDRGRVYLAGRDITGRPAFAVARAGIARSFQTPQLADGLSALDNVAVARAAMAGMRLAPNLGTIGEDKMLARARGEAMTLLAELSLAGVAARLAGDLPHGARRRLEIARAMALEPLVLALDEPAAGLDPAEREVLGAILLGVAGRGLGLLVIEHDVKFLTGIAHRLACLDASRLIALGPPAEVVANPKVVAAYLGTPPAENMR